MDASSLQEVPKALMTSPSIHQRADTATPREPLAFVQHTGASPQRREPGAGGVPWPPDRAGTHHRQAAWA